MKMTVDIAEVLLLRSREVARREGTTLRALIEEGLQAALAKREEKVSYRWPDLSIDGQGLVLEIEEGTWEPLRDRIYAVSDGLPTAI
jgi:hypothetical protein